MYVLSQKGNSPKKALLGVHVTLILLSLTLVITNACQIGMIHQHAPVYSVEVRQLKLGQTFWHQYSL